MDSIWMLAVSCMIPIFAGLVSVLVPAGSAERQVPGSRSGRSHSRSFPADERGVGGLHSCGTAPSQVFLLGKFGHHA